MSKRKRQAQTLSTQTTPQTTPLTSRLHELCLEPTPCTCDGSCEFGCIGNEHLPSTRAREYLAWWLENAATHELHSFVATYSQSLAASLRDATHVDVQLDVVRCRTNVRTHVHGSTHIPHPACACACPEVLGAQLCRYLTVTCDAVSWSIWPVR